VKENSMLRNVIILVVVLGLLLAVALIGSIVYVSTESQRTEGKKTSEIKTHLEEDSKPEQVYSFLSEAAQSAEDDANYSGALGLREEQLELALRLGKDDKRYLESLKALAHVQYVDMEDNDGALSNFKKIVEIERKAASGKADGLIDALTKLGDVERLLHQTTPAREHLNEAVRLAETSSDLLIKGHAKLCLSALLLSTGDKELAPAESAARESIKCYESAGEKGKSGLEGGADDAYYHLALIEDKSGKSKEALADFAKALTLSKEAKLEDSQIEARLQDAGWAELRAGHKAKAVEYFKRLPEENYSAEWCIVNKI
jgi:tetratricopeptide (TPR) repeat protein